MDLAAAKRDLRQEMRRRRSACDARVLSMRSRLCQANLLESSVWRKARSVALYMAMPEEVETALLLTTGLKTGKKVFLPRIVDAAKHKMQFAPCVSAATLNPGVWQILEPPPGPEPDGLDLVVLPGLAFDSTGCRLGYGGGYYDRYLGAHPEFLNNLIGFCMDFQIVDCVPAGEWDLRVCAICSETALQWS